LKVTIARPSHPYVDIDGQHSAWQVAGDYTALGVDHILSGYDHLTFVLALLLIVSGARRLLVTVTSFTLAHSITLAAATLGVMWVPGPPIEATISLSILFLASELVKVNRGQSSLTARYPWIVAFTFGLLHGFGFAGALNDIGLPQNEIALALLMFNVGVELGQLMFIAAILVLLMALRKVRSEWPAWGIGGIAAFWFIDRVAGF
jgi:hydrogenase/urease accessory protein HupE